MPRPFSAFAVATLAALAFTVSPARAEDETTALERGLADAHAALATSDCAAACRALASIRRAADKICALEPGDRCTAARAKADLATRRVREACPECATASVTPEPDKAPAVAPPPTSESPSMKTGSASPAPPSEARRGGCASCDAGGVSPGDALSGLLGVIAMAALLRRRKPRRP